MHLPFMQSVLSVQPVSLETGAIFLGLALVLLPVMELHKWWWRRRTRAD